MRIHHVSEQGFEVVDFLSTAHSEGEPVVLVLHLVVEQTTLACSDGRAVSLLDEIAKGTKTVQKTNMEKIFHSGKDIFINTMSIEN